MPGLPWLQRTKYIKQGSRIWRSFKICPLTSSCVCRNWKRRRDKYQSKIRTYVLLGGLGVFLIIALILYRNNLQKHKANQVLEHTLDDLKTTQTQLIQSEKMASLGELTAGIAHEIQNPLNFVNNFSEVNTELIDEMQTGNRKGNIDEVKTIADDIKQNRAKDKPPWQTRRCHCKRHAAALAQPAAGEKNQPISMRLQMNICGLLIMA